MTHNIDTVLQGHTSIDVDKDMTHNIDTVLQGHTSIDVNKGHDTDNIDSVTGSHR